MPLKRIFLLIFLISACANDDAQQPLNDILAKVKAGTIDQNKLISFLPVALIEKITTFNFNNMINLPRLEIWDKALKLIAQRPLWGWGASTFAVLYISRAFSENGMALSAKVKGFQNR